MQFSARLKRCLTYLLLRRHNAKQTDQVGLVALILATQLLIAGCQTHSAPLAQNSDRAPSAVQKPIQLFDGQTLAGWEPINFGGERDCLVEEGRLIIEAGDPLTGLASTRDDLPHTNYEISLSARRMHGIDFFCGLTFPVADSHCTLIVGGWSGTVVGLSNIDDQDASHNESRKLMKFEKEQWYKIRLRVEPKRIAVWIDDQPVIDQDISDKKISLRTETIPTTPLGICTFETTAEFKDIVLQQR